MHRFVKISALIGAALALTVAPAIGAQAKTHHIAQSVAPATNHTTRTVCKYGGVPHVQTIDYATGTSPEGDLYFGTVKWSTSPAFHANEWTTYYRVTSSSPWHLVSGVNGGDFGGGYDAIPTSGSVYYGFVVPGTTIQAVETVGDWNGLNATCVGTFANNG